MINDDDKAEDHEEFNITIDDNSLSDNIIVGSFSTAKVIIMNDDGK